MVRKLRGQAGRQAGRQAGILFRALGILLAVVSLLMAACSSQQAHEGVGTQGQAIVNGQTDFEAGDPWRNASVNVGVVAGP